MTLTLGMRNEVEGLSTEDTTALKLGSGSLRVLATPMMIALMERAASELVDQNLSPDMTSVGISLTIGHTSATPIGLKLRAECELTSIDGRKLGFKVRAFDERGEIGHGTHERFIVAREKFQSKADAKR